MVSTVSPKVILFYSIQILFLIVSMACMKLQESSASYDYAKETEPTEPSGKTTAEPYLEIGQDSEDPYWDPSNREDELKIQLQNLGVLEITEDSLE